MSINLFLQPDSFLSRLGDITLLLLVLFLCFALTEKYLSRFIKVDFSSPVEKFVFLEGLGLGVLAYSTLALGLCGLLYRWVFYLILLLAIYLAKDSFQKLINLLKTVKIEPSLILKYKLEASIVLLFTVFALVHLIAALCPPISWDELWYHLAVPKLYIQHHRIFNITTSMRSNWTMALHMLNLLGMLLKSDILAKLFNFSMGMLVSLAIYAFSRNYFSTKVGLLAALIFYSIPMVAWESTTAYIELGSSFFEFLAVYAVVKWLISNKDNWLYLGGVFCGLALGAKYLGAYCFISILLAVLILKKGSWSGLIKKMIVFSGIVLLIAFVWYLKNYLFTGNPGLPFLNNFFHSRQWYQTFYHTEFVVRSKPFFLTKGLSHFWLIPWHLTFQQAPYKDQAFGPIFLMFLPLLLLLVLLKKYKTNDTVLFISIYGALFFIFCMVTTAYVRLLIPLFPFACILSSLAVFSLASLLNKKASRALITFTLIMIFLNLPLFSPFWLKGFESSLAFPDLKLSIKSSLGLITREQYLSGTFGGPMSHGYPATGFINRKLVPSDKILTMNVFRYYFDMDSLDAMDYCPEYNCSMMDVLGSGTAEDFINKLKHLKIKYIIVNRTGPLDTGWQIDELSSRRLITLLYSETGTEVYAVGSNAKNVSPLQNNISMLTRKYIDLLRNDPGNTVNRLKLADIYLNPPNYWDTDYYRAVREYGKALRFDPGNIQAHLGMGNSLWLRELCLGWGTEYSQKNEFFVTAMEHFKKVLEIDPENIPALQGMAKVYLVTAGMGHDFEWRLSIAQKTTENRILQDDLISKTYTYISLDKLTVALGISLIAYFGMTLAFLPHHRQTDRFIITIILIWLVMITVNYYPQFFIPFVRMYISFL